MKRIDRLTAAEIDGIRRGQRNVWLELGAQDGGARVLLHDVAVRGMTADAIGVSWYGSDTRGTAIKRDRVPRSWRVEVER